MIVKEIKDIGWFFEKDGVIVFLFKLNIYEMEFVVGVEVIVFIFVDYDCEIVVIMIILKI